MSLINEIMSLPNATPPLPGESPLANAGYVIGHRDARHAAAELVAGVSARMEALERVAGAAREYIRANNEGQYEDIDRAETKLASLLDALKQN